MARKQVTVKGCYNCKHRELKAGEDPCRYCSLSEVGAIGTVMWERRPEPPDQVGGNHYRIKTIQPWDYIAANNLCYFTGNVVKYVSRFRDKNGVEDLKKARHYLDKLIELEEQNNNAKPSN